MKKAKSVKNQLFSGSVCLVGMAEFEGYGCLHILEFIAGRSFFDVNYRLA